MFRHSFIYSIVEEFVKIDKEILNKINKVKLEKKENKTKVGSPATQTAMNFTSFYKKNKSLDNFIKNKLNHVFKKHNLSLRNSWVQKYLKNDYHSLHIHEMRETSFVWFIEGNETSSPLYFYDAGYPLVDTNQTIKIKFIPGKLIIFPGFMPHEVRPNKNNNRLIVSGNLL